MDDEGHLCLLDFEKPAGYTMKPAPLYLLSHIKIVLLLNLHPDCKKKKKKRKEKKNNNHHTVCMCVCVCVCVVLTKIKTSGGSLGKEPACNAGDTGSIPGLARSPGGGHGNPLQYSCLKNPMYRGAWQAKAHGVTKSWTQLSD